MPQKFSSREVLSYLNELGYHNINAQQLKEFMQDLKKLIKHEERFKNTTDDSTKYLSRAPNNDNIFAQLYQHGTVESRQKIVQKKEKLISVQIKRPFTHICTAHNPFAGAKGDDNTPDNINNVQPVVQNKSIEETEKTHLGGGDNNAETACQKPEKPKMSKRNKPQASFIRPTMSVNLKSDPVALYHKYQAEWKRRKIPGEDNRAELRWAIREKMLGGPRVASRS